MKTQEDSAQLVNDLVTIRVAAERYRCHSDTIRNRITDGSLKAFRFGPKLIRVSLSDLEQLFRVVPSVESAPPLTPAARGRLALSLLMDGA